MSQQLEPYVAKVRYVIQRLQQRVHVACGALVLQSDHSEYRARIFRRSDDESNKQTPCAPMLPQNTWHHILLLWGTDLDRLQPKLHDHGTIRQQKPVVRVVNVMYIRQFMKSSIIFSFAKAMIGACARERNMKLDVLRHRYNTTDSLEKRGAFLELMISILNSMGSSSFSATSTTCTKAATYIGLLRPRGCTIAFLHARSPSKHSPCLQSIRC